ncbi:universal stress protein [Candidatus Nephthysia bennettiae]|uniref:Universal stress protein n=1 Tax=Candidatus Nephthysia bennettiae TaxID=3127016 RepID=A0A934K527_9BACT|nr:universal stress protein [Candidatus Dormibacteraeota bacterium]MBJ7610681.1 universal stress protein [Candidatus Dormibacteraeota bacterium]PZS29500.1 MAG: universal stress protein [Pseudonocardiales bacterium]
MFKRIVLAVDGSVDAGRALRATGELARLHGSEVLVVHGRELGLLMPLVPGAPAPTRQLTVDTEDEARRLLSSAVSELRDWQPRVRGQLLPRQGQVAQQIVEAARTAQADLIVLGARGMSQMWELVAGGPAQKVVRLADRPVLLVR